MNEENGERARKELGENARFFVVDVSDTESVESCVKSIGEWVFEHWTSDRRSRGSCRRRKPRKGRSLF